MTTDSLALLPIKVGDLSSSPLSVRETAVLTASEGNVAVTVTVTFCVSVVLGIKARLAPTLLLSHIPSLLLVILETML